MRFSERVSGDLFRAYGRTDGPRLLLALLVEPTIRVVLTHRLVSHSRDIGGPIRGLVLFIAKAIHRWAQRRAGVDFPSTTEVGRALKITHGWGLVVSAGARIGSNVTLFHGVTIGQRDTISPDGRISSYPVIGNDVWIGAHSIIIGGVAIGDGAIIGAGTIVTRDVAPATIVVGNPMRVVRGNCLPDVVNRYMPP